MLGRLGDDTLFRLSSELLGLAILSLDYSSHHLKRAGKKKVTLCTFINYK